MRRILVGIDGSEESLNAADQAAHLAHSLRAGVTLVNVVPPPEPPGEWATPVDSRAAKEKARMMLTAVEHRLGHANVETSVQVCEGRPPEVLAELAQAADVELVVVGHRGRGALRRLLLGSVADRLVQLCPKSVLVVR